MTRRSVLTVICWIVMVFYAAQAAWDLQTGHIQDGVGDIAVLFFVTLVLICPRGDDDASA